MSCNESFDSSTYSTAIEDQMRECMEQLQTAVADNTSLFENQTIQVKAFYQEICKYSEIIVQQAEMYEQIRRKNIDLRYTLDDETKTIYLQKQLLEKDKEIFQYLIIKLKIKQRKEKLIWEQQKDQFLKEIQQKNEYLEVYTQTELVDKYQQCSIQCQDMDQQTENIKQENIPTQTQKVDLKDSNIQCSYDHFDKNIQTEIPQSEIFIQTDSSNMKNIEIQTDADDDQHIKKEEYKFQQYSDIKSVKNQNINDKEGHILTKTPNQFEQYNEEGQIQGINIQLNAMDDQMVIFTNSNQIFDSDSLKDLIKKVYHIVYNTYKQQISQWRQFLSNPIQKKFLSGINQETVDFISQILQSNIQNLEPENVLERMEEFHTNLEKFTQVLIEQIGLNIQKKECHFQQLTRKIAILLSEQNIQKQLKINSFI